MVSGDCGTRCGMSPEQASTLRGNLRLIARLDIKGENLIKGINLEGLRIVGNPQEYAQRYYEEGADELLYMDTVASLYGRNNLEAVVRRTAENIFVPLTVGGGVRSLDDVDRLLRVGADKVAINTAAIVRPQLISEVARRFGSQCMVLSIEAKEIAPGKWEAYTDNGREKSGRDVLEWAQIGQECGAGEILLTSVDKEGTRKGFDIALCHAVASVVDVPLILSGGMGGAGDLISAVMLGGADAVAMAHVLHYGVTDFPSLRRAAKETNRYVRVL